MAIFKDLDIQIKNEEASFSEKFYVYQYDRGINLNIRVVSFNINISRKPTLLLTEIDGYKATATIMKPNGDVIGKSDIGIEGDIIKFIIDQSLTDELDEVGEYKIQFHIYDTQNNRVTLPPVSFEVKALIGVVPEN